MRLHLHALHAMHALVGALCAMLWTLAPAPARAQSEPRYVIHEREPATGSTLRREVFRSPIAVNQTYAELSAADRERLHALYEGLAPGDEPPFPRLGLRPLLVALLDGWERLPEQGALAVLVDVDAQGRATSAQALRYPSPEFARFVASLLMLEPYKPAVCKGQPCRGSYLLHVELTLSLRD